MLIMLGWKGQVRLSAERHLSKYSSEVVTLDMRGTPAGRGLIFPSLLDVVQLKHGVEDLLQHADVEHVSCA